MFYDNSVRNVWQAHGNHERIEERCEILVIPMFRFTLHCHQVGMLAYKRVCNNGRLRIRLMLLSILQCSFVCSLSALYAGIVLFARSRFPLRLGTCVCLRLSMPQITRS